MPEEPTITCPKCGNEIKLTESLAAPILEAAQKDFAEKLKQSDKQMADREQKLKDEKALLAKDKESIDETVENRLKSERKTIAEQEAKKARKLIEDEIEGKDKELKEAQELLEKKNEKLAEAQKAQAAIVKRERELEDEKREMELKFQKRIGDEISKDREKTTKEVVESERLKLAERDKMIGDLQTQLKDAIRKAEQGSQQLQGEVQELDLEQTLTASFPFDTIEPVPKGEYGGDALQRVHNPAGQMCGTILWESKRTKAWSDGWLAKLRGDQRTAKAEIAIIVSAVLPKDVSSFTTRDGVIVATPALAVPIAMMMRQQLIEIASARQAGEGMQTKTELVYQYLTGQAFRQRVEAIVEAFSSMNDDLMKEKKAILKQWAKREKQIENVMTSTVGMWGDLQGIAGKTLQEIEGLDVGLLTEGDSNY